MTRSETAEYKRETNRRRRTIPQMCSCWRNQMGVKYSIDGWVCKDCLAIEDGMDARIAGAIMANLTRRRSEELHETQVEEMWRERRGEIPPIAVGESLAWLEKFGYQNV